MPARLLSLASWAARWLPMPVKRWLYRIHPLARVLRGALNRAAPQGLTQVRVSGGGLQGTLLELDLQSEKDYWLGTYEPELQAAVTEFVKPGMVVYDVGANIGYISLLLARAVGEKGRVFAFEALPTNLTRLETNLALSGFAGQVSVVPAAVVEANRLVRFLIGPSGGMGKAQGSAGRQEYEYADSVEVNGLALDAFAYKMGNPPPEVVKMDIEGGEVLALPGMRRLLQDARPILLLEIHGAEAAQAAWDELTASGYRLCKMQAGYQQVGSLEYLDWKMYLIGLPL